MTSDFEDFRAALVRAYAQENFYSGISLTAYLEQPASTRSGDEMDIVDDKIAKPLLEALGFKSGDIIYNRTDKSGRRPDYLVKLTGYPRPPFVLEDKNTTENLDDHLSQLERYMLSHATPLGLLCNGQVLRVYEMASGIPVMVAEFSIRDFVALERGEKLLAARSIEASLRAVYARCRSDAFSGTTALLDDLTKTNTGASHDESTWPAQARIHVRQPDTAGFLSGLVEETRSLIREITWDVESQLDVRLTEYEKYRERQAYTNNRFHQLRQVLLNALEKRAVLESQRNDFKSQIDNYFNQRLDADFIGTLSSSILSSLNEALKASTLKASSPSISTPTLLSGPAGAKIKGARTTSLNSLPTDVMTPLEQLVGFVEEYHATREGLALSAREAIAAYEAYRAWQSRVSLLLLPGVPEERLRAEFSAQTAYVMVIRMMLVRILEDKCIMSRVFTNGGVALWFDKVEKRFLQYAQGQSTDFLLDLAYTSAQHIYSAFYSELRLFDWYQPDRKMVIQVLHRLAGFNLSKIDHDLIGHMYARYVEDEHKHETGMYYTAPEIVEYMLDQMNFSGGAILGKSILDNACGSGTFLVSAARRIVEAFTDYHGGVIPPNEAQAVVDAIQEQIYGLDINPFACYLAETNLLIQVLDVVKGALEAGNDIHVGRFNIYNTDTMSYDPRTRSALVTALGSAIAVERLPVAEQIKGKLGKFSNGFDFVIGNPPYVRADENAEMVLYRKRIKDLHPIASVKESMIQKWDLSVPFIALGHHLLKTKGRMAIITSNSIENVPYADIIRRQLSESQIDEVSFFPGIKLFEDAAVFNTMFFLTKNIPSKDHQTKRYWHNGKPPAYTKNSHINQLSFGSNIFRQDILKTQYSDTTPLNNCLYISVGMVLNADEKLERGAFKKDELLSPFKTSVHSKLYVEGSNLDAYYIEEPMFLEYGPGTRVPEKIRRATFPELYDRPKIMRGETSYAILDDGSQPDGWVYCNHSVILMVPWHSLSGVENLSLKNAMRDRISSRSDLEEISQSFDIFYLLALINSQPALDILKKITVSGRAGRLQPEDFKGLPIPNLSFDQQKKIADRALRLHQLGLRFTQLRSSGWKIKTDKQIVSAPAVVPPGVPVQVLGIAKVRWNIREGSPETPIQGLQLSKSGDGLYRGKVRVIEANGSIPPEALEWFRRQADTLEPGMTFSMAEARKIQIPEDPAAAISALSALRKLEADERDNVVEFRRIQSEIDMLVKRAYALRARKYKRQIQSVGNLLSFTIRLCPQDK